MSGSAWARQVDPWSPAAAARPASNIHRVEGGCITKLETLLQEHLRISGAVGLGIASVGVQRALHELLVQEPEAGALLPVSSGASPVCAPQLLTMR